MSRENSQKEMGMALFLFIATPTEGISSHKLTLF